MRAGLLSDARVVLLLRTLFVPVHITALNTPHCMRDPRDVDLLRSFAGKDTDTFAGGEREVFVLPDGRMQRVFLSLNGHAVGEYAARAHQYTAAGRRDENASRMFRHHGGTALRETHGELPAVWRQVWDGSHPDLAAIAAAHPVWPEPAAGQQGFRVFVRNSYRMYDDLHGCQLAVLPAAVVAAWAGALQAPGSRAELPRETFVALARAMVPRGMVDTELLPDSIRGSLALVATALDEQRITGTVEGRFELAPADKAEVGKRLNAAVRFRSCGALTGRFTWNRSSGTFAELRVVATGLQLEWLPEWGGGRDDDFPPRHQVGIEWVRGADPGLR